MNHDQDDLRPADAPLDALLDERLGKERAPDLTGIVAARHYKGDGAEIAQRLDEQPHVVTRGNNRPLLTAAMVLLGSVAVVGTIWSVQNEQGDGPGTGTPTAQQPQNPAEIQNPIENEQPEQSGIDLPEPGAPAEPQDPKKLLPKPQDPKKQKADEKLAVSVKVVDQHGGPVQDFEIEVHYAKGSPPRKVDITAALPRHKRHPRDFEHGFTVLKGLKPGKYVVTVEDDLHAPSESTPFEVVAGDKTPEVVIQMQKGGTIRGSVVDSKGQPVAGATVRLAEQGANPLEIFMTNQLKKRASPRRTKSNRDGSFELRRLKPGKYEVKVQHEDFSTSRTDMIQVENKAKKDVKVTLKPGARIVGRITRSGKPVGNYEVHILMQTKMGFTATLKARTDNEGRFVFRERLAPGRYKLQAMSADPNIENPFEKLLQLKETQREFEVRANQRELKHNIDLK